MTISVVSTPSTQFTIPPNQALTVENLGPGTIHWGRFAVDDTHNEGVILPSNTITFFAPFGPQVFLACDTPTSINTTFVPFPNQAAMLGTDGTLGGPSGSPLVFASGGLRPSGGDDSAALQALVNGLGTAGGTIFLGPGTFLWNAAPVALPRSTPVRIVGAGVNKTIIKLSNAAPRAFDFNKIADGDTFQNIELSDFTVDNNNVQGQHHVVIGNYQAGTLQTKFNVARLRVQRVNTINVPSQATTGIYNTATLHRLNVHIAIVDNANQATQYTISDVIIEDCNFGASGGGGDEGVFVGGTVAGGVTGLNVWMSDVHVRNVQWTAGAVPTQFYASAGVQLGGQAFGDNCTIDSCHVYYSGDVGYEWDTLMKVDVTRCLAVDCWNHGFYMKNFQYVGPAATTPYSSGTAQTLAQQWNIDRCKAERLTVTNQMHGFRIDTANTVPVGNVTFTNCFWHRNFADFATLNGEAFYTVGTVGHVLIEGFEVDMENVTAAAALPQTSIDVFAVDGAGPATFKLHNASVVLRGANNSGNTQTIRVVEANAITAGCTTRVEIDGLYVDPSYSAGNFATIAVSFGGAGSNTIGGRVNNAKFTGGAGTTSSWTGVNVASTATLTIPASKTGGPTGGFGIMVTDCDFSVISASGNQVSIGSSQGGKVGIERCGPKRVGVAAAYTVFNTDELVAVTDTTAPRTITLCAALQYPAGKSLTIVDESNAAGTNNITIARAGSDTFLGGGTSLVINTNGGFKRIYSNGNAGWIPV